MMSSLSTYLMQRRIAQLFLRNLKNYDQLEIYLEDLASHLFVWPAHLVSVIGTREGRRGIEVIAAKSGSLIRITYKPGVIRVYKK